MSWRPPLHACVPITLFMGEYGLHIFFFAYINVASHQSLDVLQSVCPAQTHPQTATWVEVSPSAARDPH